MSVKIRLKRMGKIRVPQYRIVVVDSRKKRDGKVIEEIGTYQPKEEPSIIAVTSDRAQYWLGVGAQPSEAVAALLKITGDWQKFKGLPGTEGTLKFAEPKRDKTEIFNEALKDSANEPKGGATTKKADKKAEKKADEAKAEEPKAEKKADEPKAEEPKAEETPAEVPASETPDGAAAEAETAETADSDAKTEA
ncbi:MAG: 30S ribosomal protein S16 [Nocardioides sp.]